MAGTRVRGLSRLAWVLTGLVALIWVGFEDRGLGAVTGLGWAIGVATLLSLRRRAGHVVGLRWWGVAGAVTGAMAGPLAAGLVLVKIGLHAHPQPDFGPGDVAALLGRAPLWAAAGAILGGGAGLVEAARAPGETTAVESGTKR